MDNKQNKLLASLPPEEYQRLAPHFEEVELKLGEYVCSIRDQDKYMYFPKTGIISLLQYLREGETGEIAVVGNEGVLGVWLFMSGVSSIDIRPMVQASGLAVRVPVQAMLHEFQKAACFQFQLLCYTQALMLQISQTALCNRHHKLEQQFSRWLLLSQDRLQGEEPNVIMTQELIASMLGVRREGVNHAARKLQEMGIISYKRGKITIVDREAMKDQVCECYASVKEIYQNLYTSAVSWGCTKQMQRREVE